MVIDVLSDSDLEVVGRLAPDASPTHLPKWKVAVATVSGWRGFVMSSGTLTEYRARLAEEFDDVLHDADQAG